MNTTKEIRLVGAIMEPFYRMYDEAYGAQRDTHGTDTGSDLLAQGNPTLERGEPGASKGILEKSVRLTSLSIYIN